MSDASNKADDARTSRREFIKKGSSLLVAGGMVAGSLSLARGAHSFGSDTIKIGLVGCGGRGTGAAVQALNTTGGEVKLVALGDAFADRAQAAYRGIKGQHGDKVDVPRDRIFSGFEAYLGVLSCDIDMVLLATPPGFRPLHFEAAIGAGKNVFMEKPVAVDAPGVRRVLAAGKVAKDKELAVAVGLQRRHEQAYQETIDALQGGAIGDINLTRAYWNGAGVWVRPRNDKQTELEYQMRNWYYFNWLCGDHIVEQHIHNIDVINWLKGAYPVSAQGQGGREVRKYRAGDPESKDFGQIFDHHFVEFTYADGSKMFSQCRHIKNCWDAVNEYAHGSKGQADIGAGRIYDNEGKIVFQTRGTRDGHQQEHHDLFADLRAGRVPNEAEYGALSTFTAIFGRRATYTGQMLKWDEELASEVSLANVDDFMTLDNEAPVQPDENGLYPIPIPGVL
jgi:predicted dehydrogenase